MSSSPPLVLPVMLSFLGFGPRDLGGDMQVFWRTTRRAVLVAVAAVSAGCGDSNQPQLVPVTGKVVMAGKGLTAGAIIFHPVEGNAYMKDRPSSLLQLDGSFTMKTFPFGEGVSPGTYKVTLAPELATRIGKPDYANPDKTPWSIDVPESGLAGHQFSVPAGDVATRP